MKKCEICGTLSSCRRRVGDVLACRECVQRSKRFDRMHSPKISAEHLEYEIRQAKAKRIVFEKTSLGWNCEVVTEAGEHGVSSQDHPFEAMADAFYRFPVRM